MLKNYFLIIFVIINSFSTTKPKNDSLIKDESTHAVVTNSSKTVFAVEATIEVTSNSICQGESVDITFTGMGGTAPYDFNYTVNGGANQTISSTGTDDAVTLTVTPTASETYQLVDVTDATPTTEVATDAITITVNDPPVIDFTFNNNQCSGETVQFNSTISGSAPYTYQWSFGDGQNSTLQNPTNTFVALGCDTDNFTVVLTVTDTNDCTTTVSKIISINEKPNIAFIDLNPGVAGEFNNCGNSNPSSNYTISVDNNSVSQCVDTYNINWGDGTFDNDIAFPIDHTYTSFGTFNMAVTGTGINGCTNTVSYLVKNATNPSGGISGPGNTQNLCTPTDGLQFEITGWGGNTSDTTYEIDYGDGTTITYTQTDLVNSIYFNVANPSASLPFPIAPHSYTQTSCPTEFTAKLWIRNACVENPTPATIGNILILKGTDSSFQAPDNGCVNTSIEFINTSQSGFGYNCSTDINFTWNFGDGTPPIITNNLNNISHVFNNFGNYTVTLTADNTLCEVTLFEKNICIEPALVPAFTLSTIEGCVPFTVDITNTTDLSENCGTPTYLWNVTYGSGFCGSSSQYSFTSGNASSASPSIQFSEAGTYSVTLTTTNTCGAVTSAAQNIIVKQPPTLSISPIDDACGPITIAPVATVDACSTNAATYNWTFPGGTPATSNQQNPGTISYNTVGNHVVTLTVTNECGSTTSTQDFNINPLPTITNTDLSQSICSGTETTAVTLSSDLVNTSYTWVANATPGITGFITSGTTNIIPAHTLTNANLTPGTVTYTITPTVNTCVGIPVNLVITVNPAPSFTDQPIGSSVCLNGTANTLSVSWSGTGTVTYQWYADTVAIIGANTATYDPPTDSIGSINYHCIVTFTSGGGCDEIISEIAVVEVTALLQIDTEPLALQSICTGGRAGDLFVTVSGGSGTINYQWYFNFTNSTNGASLMGGVTTNSYTPPTFNTAGSYYYFVVISATGDGCGEITSALAEIRVVNDPVVDTQPVSSQELCANAVVQDLEVVSSGGLGTFSYQWYSNNTNSSTGGTVITGATNSTYTPPTNAVGTIYYYCVITQNVSGCETVSDPGAIIIIPAPIINDQPISDSVCLNGSTNDLVVAYTNGTGIATYQWYDDTGLITGATASSYSPATTVVGISNYYCIITFTSGGCTEITSNTAAIEVVQGPQLSTQSTSPQSICLGGIPDAFSITTTGGTGTLSYQWYSNIINSDTGGTLINGATNSTYTPPAFNTLGDFYYYVIVTLAGNGCGDVTSSVAHIEVVNDPTIDTQPVISQELCANAVVQDLEVVSSGGLGTFSYQWYSNNTNSSTGGTVITGATNSTYTPPTNAVGTIYYYCVITQNVSGCETISDSGAIIIIPAPIINDQPISDSVCLNGNTDDLVVAYTNGTGIATYQWYDDTGLITGATASSYSPTTAVVGISNYYCIITFTSGGCTEITSNTAAVEVVQGPQLSTQSTSPQSICLGGIPDAFSITTTGGTGTLSYQWYSNTINSDTGGTLINGATTSTYTPPAFNTLGDFYYYVIVTLAGNGCGDVTSSVAHIEVVNDPTIDTQPVISQELCANAVAQDLIISVSGGLGNITYQWYSNTVDSTTGGTLITGATNSTFTPPTNTIGTTYYYCLVTQDISGCLNESNTASVTITLAPAFAQQPLSNTLCLGDSGTDLQVSYSNGTGTATYQWYENTINNTTTGVLITGATAASYTPPVTTVGTLFYYCIINFSSGGCTEIISNSAEITINETPNISSTTVLICSDNTFEHIPDSANGDIIPNGTLYTWTTPTINPIGSITGVAEQINPVNSISQSLINTTTNPSVVTYTVTPISGNCDGTSFEVVVTVNPAISVSLTQLNSLCFEANNGSLEININGGIPFNTGDPYQTQWTGPNGFNSTDQNIYNLIPGDYTVDIADIGGCPYTETYTITQPDELLLQSTDVYNDITCFAANDGEISVSISGGTQPYTYSWTNNGIPVATTEDLNNLEPGSYVLTVTDANNCIYISTPYTIEEPDVLALSLINQTDIICFGENSGAITVAVSGGRPNYSYTWTGPNGFTSTSQNLTTLVAGIYSITLTDQSNCTLSLEINLLQNDEISINYRIEEITCYGANNGSITIDNISGGLSPYTVAWSNLGTGLVQENLSSGTYGITVTDSLNCENTFTVLLEEAPDFYIDPLVTQISCFGENDASIALNLVGGMNPLSFVWDDDPNAGLERNNIGPGTYSVTIIDGSPCTITQTFVIFDINAIEILATVTDALDCENVNSGAIDLSIIGGTPPYTFNWSNNAQTEDLIDIPPGNYYVSITDSNNCEVQSNWEVNRFDPLVINVDTETEFNCDTREVSQSFIAQATGGVPPYQFNWLSGTVSGDNNEIMQTDQNGLVIVEVTDSFGCTTSFSYNVETLTLGGADFTLNSFAYSSYGIFSILDPIQFTNTATGDYESVRWDFGDGNFSDEENPSHIYINEGTYVVTQIVTYPYGCIYTQVITLNIQKGYSLVMPNAFTPNADGLNDYFVPEFIGLSEMKLDIYDTWGSLIYSESGDEIRGWDGKIKDSEAENGNYYFKFTAKTFYGNIIKEDGAFVSIK